MCKVLMREYPVCGVRKCHVELDDLPPGMYSVARCIGIHRTWPSTDIHSETRIHVCADDYQNTVRNKWCCRFEITFCDAYYESEKMCFKNSRNLDQDFFISLAHQGIDVERVTLLSDCAQGTWHIDVYIVVRIY